MARYNIGNIGDRGISQLEAANATMGKRQQRGPVTKTEDRYWTSRDYFVKGLETAQTGERLYKLGSHINDFVSGLNAPNANAQAVQAGAGAANLAGGAQSNTGAEVSARQLQDFFYGNPGETVAQGTARGASDVTQVSDDVFQKNLFFGEPGGFGESLVNGGGTTGSVADTGAGLAEGTAGNAQNVAQNATQMAQGGLSSLGTTVAPAVGGVAGGLAGRVIGQEIGGQTGADIGGVVGSLGGAYLGGLAMSSLAGSAAGAAGAAGGAAAGAAAGSAVPGVGTLIGAGVGALTSFFL